MLHGRSEKVWITQLPSQEWRGAGIPPQRPEIHQLQTPTDLQPPRPRVPALWQPLRDMSLGTRQDSWDKMGAEQSPQCSAALPGMGHRLDVGGFLHTPLCWTGSPISSEAAHLSDSLFVTMGLRARPACPQGPGSLPNSLLPVTSPRSCQQLKEIWGSHCLHSGLQSSLARGPKAGSTHWGT